MSIDFKPRDLQKQEYPELLKEIPDCPETLRIIGDIPKDLIPITVIGSRKNTKYGEYACRKVIKELSEYPVVIVSGLALGIDAIAHKAAIENNIKTIAVLGSGLGEDSIYPRTNFYLSKEIVNRGGALLSEFEDHRKGSKEMFPMRNRIMAGMSKITLVIECTNRSGTRITSRMATEYDRDVCAIPGPIHSELSEGSNELIKEGAYPITSGKDLMEILGIGKLNLT